MPVLLLLTGESLHTYKQVCHSHTERGNVTVNSCVSHWSFLRLQMSNPRCSYFRPVFCSLQLTCIGADFFHLHSGKHGKRCSSTLIESIRGREADGRTDGQNRKCLKAQETHLKKQFPSFDPTPASQTSLTALPMHTLKHLYTHACLLMVLPVNYLPWQCRNNLIEEKGSLSRMKLGFLHL